MQAYNYGIDGAFASIVEEEKTHRLCKLHLQSWVYIHSALSMLVALLGIALGITFLVSPEWHEKLHLYKLTLAYLRRADPLHYWLVYKVLMGAWISGHFFHLASIIVTLVAVQKTSTVLLKPQLVILTVQLGVLIIGLAGLVVISVTGARIAWIAIVVLVFFFALASTNLALIVAYHRLLDDKMSAIRELLGTGKTVHFKENMSM